jgi:16S rRNA processing protein RimM
VVRCSDPTTTVLLHVTHIRLGDEAVDRKVLSAQSANVGLLLQLEGVTDRNQAEALKGREVRVARTSLPPPEEGEFYFSDLVGLRVTDPQGVGLGVVALILETGAVPVLQIEGGPGGELLVPFAEQFLIEVDIPGKRLVIDPPVMDVAP